MGAVKETWFCRAEKEMSEVQRETALSLLEGPSKSFTYYFSVYLWKETTKGHGKRHKKGDNRNIPEALIGLGIIHVSTVQSARHCVGHQVEYTEGYCLSFEAKLALV